MKNDILGHFYLEGRFFCHILEWFRTHRKMLYILQEINPRWLQMKKCLFMKDWGWDQTHEVKVRFLIVEIQFLKKVWKKRINVRAFSILRIGLRCHMRSNFEETVFPNKSVFWFVYVFGGWFWTFPKRFLQVCNHFGL